MRFTLDNLNIYFPFNTIFKEQYEYMKALRHAFENEGHGILEMPTGTGKTVSLLACILSYLATHPDKYKKVIYCTRTVVEMEKTLEEVREVIKTRKLEFPEEQYKFVCSGLTARKNLCINKDVRQLNNGDKVDAECRKRTSHWVRLKNMKLNDDDQNKMFCPYFETFEEQKDELKFDDGVYNLDDIKGYGKKNNVCPYFLAKKIVAQSNVIVYNYLYMLDPQLDNLIPEEIRKDCIVVFDEAHNIDNICLEAFSVKINKALLNNASQNVDRIQAKLDNVENTNKQKMEQEYQTLLKGLQERGKITQQKVQESKDLPEEMKQEAIPFSIRKARPFINHLKKLVIFLKNKLKEKSDAIIDPPQFLKEVQITNKTDTKTLKFTEERLSILMNTLEIAETDEYKAISQIARFSSLLSQYAFGFKIIFQPNPRDGALNDPFLNFACLDSSLAIKPVFEAFKSVILTSGTMSPLEMLPKILDFKPVVCQSINIELTTNTIQPLIITKGIDFSELSSEYQARNNIEITRSYALLLLELCQLVPDGIVVFFPSYMYMEKVIQEWNEEKILDQLQKHKLLYFESKDVQQCSTSLQHYRRACDSGRGAVFFSIARGKIAEGIDFNHHYGRCVLMLGFPVQNSNDPILLERCKFLTENHKISKNDYIEFDAMRQAAQCLGRVIRGKKDYGLMVMAEKRFARSRVKSKLPKWIKRQMKDSYQDISIDLALNISRIYYKEMGNDFELDPQSYFTKQYFEEQEAIKQQQKENENDNLENSSILKENKMNEEVV